MSNTNNKQEFGWQKLLVGERKTGKWQTKKRTAWESAARNRVFQCHKWTNFSWFLCIWNLHNFCFKREIRAAQFWRLRLMDAHGCSCGWWWVICVEKKKHFKNFVSFLIRIMKFLRNVLKFWIKNIKSLQFF